jgi:hypothetical protein
VRDPNAFNGVLSGGKQYGYGEEFDTNGNVINVRYKQGIRPQ